MGQGWLSCPGDCHVVMEETTLRSERRLQLRSSLELEDWRFVPGLIFQGTQNISPSAAEQSHRRIDRLKPSRNEQG